MTSRIPALIVGLALLSACAPTPEAAPPLTEDTKPVRTQVTDLDAFAAFIATRPTPNALRARYPGLLVVLPGDIATKELRGDNSRYFVELGQDGRVIGGQFQ